MDVKRYLEQYRDADMKAKRLRREYEQEKSQIDEISSPLGSDGMPHGTNISDPSGNKAIHLADKRLKYIDAVIDAIEIRQRIFDKIINLEAEECDVLYFKYIEYISAKTGKPKTWEEVADEVHYSRRTVFAIRDKAFKKLKCALFCTK